MKASQNSLKRLSFLSTALSTFLMNFSAYSNTVKLFDVNMPKNANHLECLDGIRFLSISWVVLGHTLSNVIQYFSITDVSFVSRVIDEANILECLISFSNFQLFNSFWFQAVDNAYASVDTFFLMSGCLVTYLMLKELDKVKGNINFLLLYVHRYLR